jgi:hypothetical protein
MTRHCTNPACRREIAQCNGFCLSSDIVLATDGRIPWSAVRELCWACERRFEPINAIVRLLRVRR